MGKVRLEDMELEEELSPMQETLEQAKTTLRQHFEIKDWQGIEIILGTAAAHFIPGEMVWLRFIGPSRSGRTELLRAVAEHPDCAEMEVLTPAAFRGGLKKGPKVLDRINGKLVITKDIASILTARKDLRTEIFGVLRGIKDGKLTSDFGSEEGHLVQEARFDWILAATTSGIEQQRQLEGLLGQRFIDLRWQPGNREEMAYRAALNNPLLDSIRAELAVDVLSLMFRAIEEAKVKNCVLSDENLRWIAKVADTTAILRTPVQQDKQGHILSLPEPEIGTELAQGFTRIVGGLLCLGLTAWQPYISRLARDSVPSVRVKLLRNLENKPQTVDQLNESTGIPERSIYYHLEHLELLKVVKDSNGVKELAMTLP